MNSSQGDVSSTQGGKVPLLFLAFGAIFLLAFFGFRSVEELHPGSFLASPLQVQGNLFVSEVSADKGLVPEAPELVFIEQSGVRASIPPLAITPKVLGAIVGQLDADLRHEVLKYAVEAGDTSASIAEKFGITLETVLWANSLQKSSVLTPGKQLDILPVSGTLHLVRPNDTISEIANWYKASAEEVIAFNGLETAQSIFAGDLLIIPNGVMPKSVPQSRLTPIANSYFIYPIGAPHRVTQRLHSFNAVDFSNGECGEPIYAAAGGTVQRVGFTSIGGRYVRIMHPNGVVTYYGHLSSAVVAPEARVLQGQIIGYSGYTGYTIPRGPGGCHLHFEVRGASNPFR